MFWNKIVMCYLPSKIYLAYVFGDRCARGINTVWFVVIDNLFLHFGGNKKGIDFW